MTLDEVSKSFCIDRDKLLCFEKSGLLDCCKKSDGTIDYSDETLEYLSLIELLLEAGLPTDTLKEYSLSFKNDKKSSEEKLKILIKQRYALLSEIHDKEKTLQRLDYLIHEAKKEKKQ